MKETVSKFTLGINGLGRIGKLTLWHHAARRHFPGIVVNLGRPVGSNLEAVCSLIEKDSTYGRMHCFLFGVNAGRCISIVDRAQGLLDVAGIPVTILQEARNPCRVQWSRHGVRMVVDTTGAFNDPSRPAGHPNGSLRGHLDAGAETVINSAAFKLEETGTPEPEDAVTLIYGINHECFDPSRHQLVSAASCTTTALAHMVKPLLDDLGGSHILTASMSTVHAVTNSQSLLDTVPRPGARDLRRNRSVFNSIILTSTNAAKTLEQVIPDIAHIGFMADSVRVPVSTESLIILNLTFQAPLEGDGTTSINRQRLNRIYAAAAAGAQKGLLVYSEEQNVSADVTAVKAAVVIESVETHTRTGLITLDLSRVSGIPPALSKGRQTTSIQVPVTHAKIFGWYDNEYGSYTNLLGDLTVHLDHLRS